MLTNLNEEISAHYIFSRSAADVQKYDVRGKNRTIPDNWINPQMRENLMVQRCPRRLYTQKIIDAQICPFTVFIPDCIICKRLELIS